MASDLRRVESNRTVAKSSLLPKRNDHIARSQLTVQATDTNDTATLTISVTSTGEILGLMMNQGEPARFDQPAATDGLSRRCRIRNRHHGLARSRETCRC